MAGKRKAKNDKWTSNKKKVSKGEVIHKQNGNWAMRDPQHLAEFIDWLYQWAQDVNSWGQDVRDDILRLEGHAGFATGDPGDPPDGPLNGDDGNGG